MNMPPSDRLRTPVLLAYALPAFVIALPTLPVYIHLPALYGVELGVGLTATGLALLTARFFDTLTDPVVGYVSDRFTLFGMRRKPLIAAGAVVAGWALVKLLSPPPEADTLYLLTWSVVLYAGWTLVAVPYQAWGAELSGDYNERTRITGWREATGLAGMVGAGVLMAGLAQFGSTDAADPVVVAWAAVVLGGMLFPLLAWIVPDPPDRLVLSTDASPSRRLQIRSLLDNKPFLRLLSAWFLNGLANGIPAALFYIYLDHGLGVAADARPVFVLIYFAAAILAVPLWLRASRRIGKHRAWCAAMIVACAAFILVPWIPYGSTLPFAVVCIITGAALGADLALPPSLQADVVDYDCWRFGQDRTGLQFALWGMATKLALAAAVGLALPGIEVLGFDPVASSAEGRTALTVIYAGLPVVIKITAVAIVWGFPLTSRRQDVLRRRLRARGGRCRKGEATP